MKKNKTIRMLFGAAAFLFILQNVFSAEIRGRLLDERYFPLPDIIVAIAGGRSTKTDSKGNFVLYTDKSSYNLFVIDLSNSRGALYLDLTTQTPELFLFGSKSSKNVNTDILRIEFPQVSREKNVILKFISESIYYSQDVYASGGESNKVLTVEYPSYTNFLNGKVLYLEKTQASFDRYGEKNITIAKDAYPQTVIFDSLIRFENPGESFITLYPPAFAYDRKKFSVYVDFLSLHRNSSILLNTTEGDIIGTKVLVPLNLPYGYRLRVEGENYFKRGDGFINLQYTYPGASLNLPTETPVKLDEPQDKYWYANDKTRFSWDWGSGTGIYVVHFHSYNPVGDFYVVTNDRSVYSPFTYSKDVLDGNEYSWKVIKYLTYLSVNDYVKPRIFSNDLGYKAVTESEMRTFKKKPGF